MDPLSLTANIIAVVSAASNVSKGLQKFISLRNAPQELLQFLNEVLSEHSLRGLILYPLTFPQISDIQIVLTLVGDTCTGLGDENATDLQIKNHLNELLSRATKSLAEFDGIMKNKIEVQSTNTTFVKFSWSGWIQNASRLKKLSEAMKTSRLDMNHTLTMITAWVVSSPAQKAKF